MPPVGYKIEDHPRTGRTGGGTALIFRDTLNVKKSGWWSKRLV